MGNAEIEIELRVNETVNHVKKHMASRGTRASNELMNAKNLVLRGRRSGRRYRVPNTRRYYTASAPGEVPAVRTGQFRNSWYQRAYAEGDKNLQVHAQIESRLRTAGGKYLLGEILEEGTPGGKIASRPYQEKIIDTAKKNIVKIFEEPYL